jgi:hypothetical protein
MKNCGDSSSGSESAPSDDNLQPEEIIKIIPVIDKKTRKDLELKKQKLQQPPPPLKSKETKRPIKKSESRANLQEKKKPGEKSLARFPIIDFDPKRGEPPNPIKEEETKKKPKPEMVDAWTQTERSDYAIIKSRLKSLNRDFSQLKGAGLY